MKRHVARVLVAVVAIPLLRCLPEFEFEGSPAPDGGGGSAGGSTSGECASDDECPSARPRCDLASSRCRACLPEADNCRDGYYCTAAFVCREGCKDDLDCQRRLGRDVFTCQPHPDDPTNRICTGCGSDDDCPANNICTETTECAPGCRGDESCAEDYQCCPAAEPTEPGTCRLTLVELENCGSCGNVCPTPDNAAAPTCAGGVCGFDCQMFYQDCDGRPENGCEVYTLTDPANCGTCGEVCGGTCVDGTCL
jgi:hypothetical protein